MNTSDKANLKLEGRLVGPWVEELRKTVLRIDEGRRPIEVEVSNLTFADENGEEVLCWLHKMGARFHGYGAFSLEYLFERLDIPVVRGKRSEPVHG